MKRMLLIQQTEAKKQALKPSLRQGISALTSFPIS
jgi:hypothetical protein